MVVKGRLRRRDFSAMEFQGSMDNPLQYSMAAECMQAYNLEFGVSFSSSEKSSQTWDEQAPESE